MWSDGDLGNDSGVLPVNEDNSVGNWTNTTMNITKTPKRIRNSTEDEEVNIEGETSEGSDLVQRRRRLNKKARRAKAKLFPETPIEKPKETETEIGKEKTTEKAKPTPAGRPFRRQGNQPPPTFLQHPVVLEDLGTGVASFLDNGPRTASLFQRTIGPILSQRPLPSGKFLIGCRSRQQQEALLKTKVLGGVNVACSIPQPTTEGVIRPVPTNVDCQFLVDRSTIKEVRRLTNRDGTRSQAIKITFFSPQLPSSIKLDYQEFVVHAYVPPVRRCTTCNKLGHLKAQCRSTVPVCPRCGSRGHTPDVCPNKLCCLNCGGPHSAAYQGCPQQRLRLIANRIRSGTFIPYSEALKRAHVEVEDRKKPLQPIAETAPHDPFWREKPAVSKTFEPPKRSYADAAGNKVQTCVPAILKNPTVLAARALKTKAKKTQIQTNIEKLRLNRLEQQLIERVTEKVVHSVQQRLTATVATQTESPRAVPIKTVAVEVQVNLENKVSVATQTIQLDDGWVSEPEIEEPMNQQPSVNHILARLCALTEECLKPKSPPQVAQVVVPPMPPVPFETVSRKKRRGKKQKDKDANFGHMSNK